MKKMYRLSLILAGLIFLSFRANSQNQITYGFLQNPANPLQMTAVAYPNFTSSNVTISTAVFSFLLPAGTLTNPSVPPVTSGNGSFTNITGSWQAQRITPAVYQGVGFNPNDLAGNDVYQVVLQNSPAVLASNGQPIQLFSFILPADCIGGNVEVLTNDSPIQQAILANLGSNFNNQMSMSINDAPSVNIYFGNNPANFRFPCSLDSSPVANPDNVVTDEDVAIKINVQTNDSYGNNPPAVGSITILTPPSNGTASVDNNGTPNDPTDDKIDYNPNPNYFGPDQLIYRICDLDGDCDTAIVRITVNPVNDLPIAYPDNAVVDEDASVLINVTANDDFGGDGPSTSAITILTPPANGTASVNNNGTPSNPTDDRILYTPNPNYFGPDQLIYRICDSNGDCDTAIVRITVNPVNDLPIANPDNAVVDEDAMVLINVTTNDDFGGDGPSTSAITIVTPPANGTAAVDNNGTPNNPTDDKILYAPNPNYFGPDQLIYRICDSNGDCDTAIVRITVNPVNDLPIANPDNAVVDEDASVLINVTANDDFGGDGPSTSAITIVTPPANGTASVNNNGTPSNPTDDRILYTPNPNYFGADQLIYRICDSNGDCDTAIVRITVNSVNDLPIAYPDQATTDQGVAVLINVTLNDDFGGDGPSTSAITIVTPPANGTATVDNNGTATNPTDDRINYTPAANFSGQDQLIYRICDSNGDCDTAIVRITVQPTNVRLALKVLLQGALLGNESGLMRDDLRSKGFLPSSEPYAALGFTHTGGGGGETVANPASVFSNQGNNSIVDWVFVELRSAANPVQVLATRSALVQRDGDVVDMDGVSALLFSQSLPGSYYVAVRHRNHLGTMTKTAIALAATGTLVDFTSLQTDLWEAAANFDGVEQITLSNRYALWAGNTNVNGSVVFAGELNDKDPIFNQVDGAAGNLFRLQTYIFPGYHTGDVNMDGNAIFAGENNDVDPIFNNVDGHPRNLFRLQTFVIPEQLAK